MKKLKLFWHNLLWRVSGTYRVRCMNAWWDRYTDDRPKAKVIPFRRQR